MTAFGDRSGRRFLEVGTTRHAMRILAATALLATPVAAAAQEVRDVAFAAGNFGAMVSGSVTGQEYLDFRLGAQAGQEMFVELTVTETDGSGTVYFNVLPPGSDGVAIYNASMDGTTATVDLPEDGTYTIRVYQMGDDEDSGKTSSFNMDLSIQ